MNVPHRALGGFLLCAMLALAAPLQGSAAEAAGKIVFVIGQASIVGADGNARPARRGAEIFSGETLLTEQNGRMQVRYSDGSFVSLLPKTEYKIEDYKFSGSADGSERGFFRLLKGGLRTVTGTIGKVKNENYKVTTPVASIGIRGTWFSALLDDFGRLLVTVGFDPDDPSGLTIANAVGTLELDRGENAVVENADTPPVKTEQQVVLEAPPPPPAEFSVAEDRTATGNPAILGGNNTIINLVAAVTDNATTPPVGVEGHPVKGVAVVVGSPPVGLFGREVTGMQEDVLASIDLNKTLSGADPILRGEIQPFVDAAPQAQIDFFKAKPAQNANFQGFNPVLAWGRWTNGRILVIDNSMGMFSTEVDDLTGNQSWHYILGSEAGPLPTNTVSVPYGFIGGTPSTSETGATIGAGVTSGSLLVNFGAMPSVDVNFIVNHNAANYSVTGNVIMIGDIYSTQFPVSGVLAVGGAGACVTSCGTKIDGFLAGPPAGPELAPSHSGFSYIVLETDPIHGVAGFQQ